MPYILDPRVTSDIKQWMCAAVPAAVAQLDESIVFPVVAPPQSLQKACHYRPIQSICVLCPAEGGFVAVATEAFPDEEAVGGNVWLLPDFSEEDVKKVLEHLAT